MKTYTALQNTCSLKLVEKIVCCLWFGFTILFGNSVLAQSSTNLWTGTFSQVPSEGDANWSSSENWNRIPPRPFDTNNPALPGMSPDNDGTAAIYFAGQVGLTPFMNQAWNVHSVVFQASAGAFVCAGGNNTLTIQAGITNESVNLQTFGATASGTQIRLGASQNWVANLGNLMFNSVSLINNNGKELTISGNANTIIFPKMSGPGGLIKNGTGGLFIGQGGAFNNGFTGPIAVNQGILQIDGSQTVKNTTGVTLNGGVLALNRASSIGSSTATMTFNGGKLQANSLTNNLNASDFFGTLVISNNSSSIDLDPNNANQAVLTFAGGSRTGSGNLTINGWSGIAGNAATDDRIVITAAPDAAFLNAIQFAAFPQSGAARLASGEIVPVRAPAVWNGGNFFNDNWTVGLNWVGGSVPLNNGTALIVFDGTTRPTPFTDVSWDVLGINFASTAGEFTNSGSQLTVRSHGITNYSSLPQTIANNVILAAPQTWNAFAGPLFLGGANNNGGFTVVIDGALDIGFLTGSGLSGSGGLTKNGAGTLTISSPQAFTGPIQLNSGGLEATANNVINNQPIILNGGNFSSLSKSQTFGSLSLTTDSTINLDTNAPAGVLTFASGLRSAGTLTINGWSGTGGASGSDDKIIMNANPGTNFLDAIQFTGFPTGAVYLAGTGEIVPPGVVQPAQPILTSPMRLSDTSFQFTLLGTSNQSYTIQSSTSFTNWTPILTTNAPSDSFTIVDTNATNGLNFYRALANP